MKRFVLIVAGALLALELGFRVFERTLFDASHRVLFKIAVLDKQPEVSTVVLGSSRHAVGFLPAQFDARLRSLGHAQKSFNLATTGISREIEAYLLDRLRGKHLELVVVEMDGPALDHEDLAWGTRHPLALLRLRSVLRHDSLVRLGTIGFAATRFDGSEITGLDYLATLRDGHVTACDECEDVYPLPDPVPPHEAALLPEVQSYVAPLAKLKSEGAQIVISVPPTTLAHHGRERGAEFKAQIAALSAMLAVPVYDFTEYAPEDLRDTHHLGPRGAQRYTDALARIAASKL